MKASELRIGNLLYFFKDTPAMVVSISSDSLYLTQGGGFINPKTEECKPIPLTEEWLLKFGFEKYKDFFFIEWNEFSFSISEYEDGKFIIHKSFNYFDIIYVHQLQNLYFALTGEELCIGKT